MSGQKAADRLGASASFAQAARPISARRAAIAEATGAPTMHAGLPTKLPVNRISFNPDNPRESLGDVSELGVSLREHGQKQACAVMTRAAYVAANPGREGALEPGTDHVVIDGNRRLAGARESGLASLKVTVDDTLGSTLGELVESALIANVHRADVPPLDQARAIQGLLNAHGSQENVARKLGKSGAWVSQRLALLELPEDLQDRVETGELTVKDGRRIGRLPREQQHEEAEKALNRVKAPRKRSAIPQPAPADRDDRSLNPVKPLVEPGRQGIGAATDTGSPDGLSDGGQAQTVNRVKTPEATGSGMIPLGPPKAMADALVQHLSRENLKALVGILTERL